MFNVNNQPATFKFTAPLERHGQEPVSSTSLRFTLALHSGILHAFHAGLRGVLYRAAASGEQPQLPAEHPDGLTQLALPKLAPLVIEEELPGYQLGMSAGLDCSDIQQFDKVKLSNFNLEALNGGTVKTQVSAHFHPTPDQVKWIYEQQGKEVQITLTPPLAGAQEEASPQATLPGIEAGGEQLDTIVRVEFVHVDGEPEESRCAKCFDPSGEFELIGAWLEDDDRPTLDEIAITYREEIGRAVHFTDECRAQYEREEAEA